MGNIFTLLYNLKPIGYFRTKDGRILMLGLDSSGKTTILYKLKFNEIITTIPTIGFNVETISYNHTNFTIWDVGGSDKIRLLWRHYYTQTKGLVFVVDSQDRARLSEAKDELEIILQSMRAECKENPPVLIWNNKSDLENGISLNDVEEEMKDLFLNEKIQRNWTILDCSAKSGSGLYDGLDWLSKYDKTRVKFDFWKFLTPTISFCIRLIPNLVKKVIDLLCFLRDSIWTRIDARILLLGLDAPGKTTLLYRLKVNETVVTIPTIGFNVETIDHKRCRFTMYDIGGGDKIRPLWRHYAQNVSGIIFVVDAADLERIEEAKEEFLRIYYDTQDFGNVAAFLIFANKQDKSQAMKIDEFTEKFGLNSLARREQDYERRRWYLQATCAISGDGIDQGLDWLADQCQYLERERERLKLNYGSSGQSSIWF